MFQFVLFPLVHHIVLLKKIHKTRSKYPIRVSIVTPIGTFSRCFGTIVVLFQMLLVFHRRDDICTQSRTQEETTASPVDKRQFA